MLFSLANVNLKRRGGERFSGCPDTPSNTIRPTISEKKAMKIMAF